MKNLIERRHHLRVPLDMQVILNTPNGAIKANTADISVSGLGVNLLLEEHEFNDKLQVLLKSSDNHELSLACEKVWSGKSITDETIYDAVGFKFTKISTTDREAIASMVERYYLN